MVGEYILIDSDLFIALIKKEDRLKQPATKLIKEIREGKIIGVYASTAVIQEVVFWLMNENRRSEITRITLDILNIENIEWIDLSTEIITNAAAIINDSHMSPFDAYHAATALTRDRKIVSSDRAYDKIHALERTDLASFS